MHGWFYFGSGVVWLVGMWWLDYGGSNVVVGMLNHGCDGWDWLGGMWLCGGWDVLIVK